MHFLTDKKKKKKKKTSWQTLRHFVLTWVLTIYGTKK
jgi:hypothetical protein